MTMEELEKATWSDFKDGIECIVLENSQPDAAAAVHYIPKGLLHNEEDIFSDKLLGIRLDSMVLSMLTDTKPSGKRGFLKVNLGEITPGYFSAMVYLKDDNPDSLLVNENIVLLRKMPGAKDVMYTSRDQSAEKNAAEKGTQLEKNSPGMDFHHVIQVKFDKKKVNMDDHKQLTEAIRDILPLGFIKEIYFPYTITKGMAKYEYIVEYRR